MNANELRGKARRAVARKAAEVWAAVRRGLASALETTPAKVQSDSVKPLTSRQELALTLLDDSRMYRDPRFRDPEAPDSAWVLARLGAPVVTYPAMRQRLFAAGSDRYIDLVAEVPELAKKQGLSGTVTAGGLPQTENNERLKPFLARGLTFDQGVFKRMLAGFPEASDGVRRTVERIAQASSYYAAPDVDWEAMVTLPPGASLQERKRQADAMRVACERAAETLNLEWYHNSDVNAQQVVREQAQAMVCGFALHEFGIDPRLQGRRRTTFVEHRAQSSVQRWLWDQNERWRGVVQNAAGSPGLVADIAETGVKLEGMPVIDARKLCLVTNNGTGLNLEGVSDLRAAWFASEGKTEWFLSALVHRRKWGNGFPLFRMDAESARSSAVSQSISAAARNFFYSRESYVSLPPGVTMEMLEFDSDTGFIQALEYFDKQIMRALDVAGDGAGYGNWADVQTQERLRRLKGYARQINQSRQRWVETCCDVLVGPLAVYPEHRFDGIMTRSETDVIAVYKGIGEIRAQTKADGSPLWSEDAIRTLCETVEVPYDDPAAQVAPVGAAADNVDQGAESDADAATSTIGNDSPQAGVEQPPNLGTTSTATAMASVLAAGGQQPVTTYSAPTGRLAPRGKRGSVIVFGADGEAFATHRDLVGMEVHVPWARLFAATTTEADALTTGCALVAKRQQAAFVKETAEAIAAGDVGAIARADVSMRAEYLAVIAPMLTRWAGWSAKAMRAEIRSQVGAGYEPAPEPATMAAGVDDVVRARSEVLAAQFDDDWQRRLREKAMAEATSTRSIAAVAAEPVPVATWEKSATNATTTVANVSREEVARSEGPEIESATYSAIMDGDTCSECAGVDLQVFDFGTAAYVEHRPPYRMCMSRLGPNGNVCRCIYIYRFKRATGPNGGGLTPTPDGIQIAA